MARKRLRYLALIPAGKDRYVWTPNFEQVTGPEFWQRVGVQPGQYVFREPLDDKPMCVGGNGGSDSFAGFRRIVDARPYRGRRVRFTAWAASREADQVHFWLAAGTDWVRKRRQDGRPANVLLNGGTTNNVPWGGSHGWTPILLETAPIAAGAEHISYGFNLHGSGDIWVYKPTFEIVSDDPPGAVGSDRIVIGTVNDGKP